MADSSFNTTGEPDQILESSDEFEAAYQTHVQPIYRFLYWRTQNVQLSEDLTSHVFEKAWRGRRSFQGGSVSAWLYRIARNVLIDHWRRKSDLPTADIETLALLTTDPSPGETWDTTQRVQLLQTAIAQLPPQMRAVITLRFIDGRSSQEVATQLNLSDSNVRIIQFRALKRLKDQLS